jgi:rhodanese-related sulfurtransferase
MLFTGCALHTQPTHIKDVQLSLVKQSVQDNSALLIDARPYMLYLAGTIPGSLSIPDTEVEALKGRLPSDLKTSIITFCAGYQCVKSYTLAKTLQSLGYENVSVYAGGYPEWKEANVQATEATPSKHEDYTALFVEGIKLGSDVGTVDGEWFKTQIVNGTVPTNVLLVDVRSASEYTQGHIQGSINLEAASLNASALSQALPKDKVVIFTCQAGNRSLEAFYKLKKAGVNVQKVLYFNASFTCNAQNQCDIKLNRALGTK